MAAVSEDELKLSRRFKEHLQNATFRNHLKNYLEKYEKDTKLKVLTVYEQLQQKSDSCDEEIRKLVENVDGLQYNPNAKNKRLDLIEQCNSELEIGINKTHFFKYLPDKITQSALKMIEKEESGHVKDGIIDFTAGCLGGIALVYVGQPLDTVKVKMQTFPILYTNMVDCFRKTYLQDGIVRGLYAGTAPALVTNIMENSVLFLCYGFCQKLIIKASGAEDLSVLSNAWAGFLASFFSSIAITPTELVKCKLQAMHEVNLSNKYIGPLTLTRQIIKNEGFKGLFRGLVPTLAREMPGYFFFFGGYEGTRELLRQPGQKKEDLGLWKTMLAGGVGGGVFWTTTFPFDVAKSRIQITNTTDNMWQTMRKIVRNEGLATLYKGLTPTLIRTIPATATLFATVEYSKKMFHWVF